MDTNTSKKKNVYLWTEYYRPKKVKDIIMPKHYKRIFNKFVKDKEIPNLLLYSSSPGVGKTTLAKALCEEMNASYLYINVSSESGIDTLRSKIETFATSRSIMGGNKVIIMDEFDGASMSLQKGLRAAVESYHKVCRFIFTCNYISQIIEPLKSRLQLFDMNYSDETSKKEMYPKIFARIIGILKNKKIEFSEETIKKLIKQYYPDIRNIIQICHKYSNLHDAIDEGVFDFVEVDKEFYQFIIKGNFGGMRKMLIEKAYNIDEMFTDLYQNFIPMLEPQHKAPCLLLIGQYMNAHINAIDKEINFVCLIVEIIRQLND